MKRMPHFLGVLLAATLLAVIGAGCKRSYTGIPISDLRQMAPFKAKVEKITVVDHGKVAEDIGVLAALSLQAEDRRRIFIGGELSKPAMVEFIRSFEKGRTYEFPNALLDFEQRTGLTVE